MKAGSVGTRDRENKGSGETLHPAYSPERPAKMRPCPRGETSLAVADFQADSAAEAAHLTASRRQRHAKEDFMRNFLYFQRYN